MKKIYEQPMVEPVEIKERYAIMTMDSEGETEDPMGKEHDDVVDEEEEGDVASKNVPFSNVDNKKGWD